MANEPVAVGVAAGVMGSAGAAGVAEVVGRAGGEGVWRGWTERLVGLRLPGG